MFFGIDLRKKCIGGRVGPEVKEAEGIFFLPSRLVCDETTTCDDSDGDDVFNLYFHIVPADESIFTLSHQRALLCEVARKEPFSARWSHSITSSFIIPLASFPSLQFLLPSQPLIH